MNVPPRPEGDDREAIGLKAIWDALFDPKTSLFIDEEGAPVRFSKQADGRYRLHHKIRPGTGGTSAPTRFRGEWLSSATYAAGDEVVITLGANRGTYVYVAYTPSAGNQPWVGGGYWFKTSESLGLWM